MSVTERAKMLETLPPKQQEILMRKFPRLEFGKKLLEIERMEDPMERAMARAELMSSSPSETLEGK